MLTRVPGVYKVGFTLGVLGITYSAYSLTRVRVLCTLISLNPTEGLLDHRGSIKRYRASIRICPVQ